MISGGIDSPLAAYYTMKRGGKISLVHFHSMPYTNSASIDKVKEIISVLQQYQPRIILYSVPLAEIQKIIRTDTDEKYRILLYRRFMIRIAETLSKLEKAKAMVTGEVLGQVASQTLENMHVVEIVSSLPVLRPLIGFDKREIVDQTKQMGTFEISIQPDQDCCSLFVPKHPATKARLIDIEKNESNLDVGKLVKDAVNLTEKFILSPDESKPRLEPKPA
jgi:thiamine biosynthesis protein ThiI